MKIPRVLSFLILLPAISCQPSAKPSGDSAASEGKAESKKGTITVTDIDGRELPPEEQEAIGAWFKKRLSDAVVKALNEGIKDLLEELDINDPMEAELLSVKFGPEKTTGDELWSVYLIRPGGEIKEPRTIVLLRQGKPSVRFTRMSAPVERPIAVMSVTGFKDQHLAQIETCFVYGTDEKWKQYRPSEQKKRLKSDRE
jgi:hypothetical protein